MSYLIIHIQTNCVYNSYSTLVMCSFLHCVCEGEGGLQQGEKILATPYYSQCVVFASERFFHC